MQGSGACWRWSEDGNRLSWDCSLRKPSNAPQGQRIGGYGSSRPGPMHLRRKKVRRKSTAQKSGGPQGPVGQVSRGLGARAPRAWGPAHQGPGAFSPQNHPTSQITIFRKPPGKAWVSAETAASEVGTWRETKPGYPPYPAPHSPAFWGCKGERKRVFTLSAFGNHPTRPPRSADISRGQYPPIIENQMENNMEN